MWRRGLLRSILSGYSYTQDLINIRSTTPMDLSPVLFCFFLASTVDLLVYVFAKKLRRYVEGIVSRVVRMRLRRRWSRTPLHGMFLCNMRSLCNKMDELTLMMWRNWDLSSSCALCFTETWLRSQIPNCALQLKGFQGNRERIATGNIPTKGRNRVVCFEINRSWCTDVSVVSQHCSPTLEYFFITFLLFTRVRFIHSCHRLHTVECGRAWCSACLNHCTLSNDSASAWKGLRQITSQSPRPALMDRQPALSAWFLKTITTPLLDPLQSPTELTDL